MFLQDLEEDPEYRAQINIYKDEKQKVVKAEDDDEWESDEDVPEIKESELITEGKEPKPEFELEDGDDELEQI